MLVAEARARVDRPEPEHERAARLAQETAEVARSLAPDAAVDDAVLELFYLAGYAQGQDDARRRAE